MASNHPTKLFVLGVTGYIGGDALYVITQAHPEYEITALVRNSDKGSKVAQQYPKVKLVYGDLDSVEVIEEEAKRADVVLNWASADHIPAANAIIKGLKAHDSPSKPGFLIHTSGTGVVLWADHQAKTYGLAFRDHIYDDLDIKEINAIPDDAPHRNVDKIILAAGGEGLKTAVVCPPCIYGEGRGPDNKRSIQLPLLCKSTLQLGYAPMVNEGKTYWGNVHVHDLSDMYLKLVEEAAAGGSTAEWSGKAPTWGAEGYYFCENGEHVWGEVSQWVADEAKKQGFIESNEVKSLSPEKIHELSAIGPGLWGANSRARANRGREVLGWKPTRHGIKEEVKYSLEVEAKGLGVKPGHAAVAAGDK